MEKLINPHIYMLSFVVSSDFCVIYYWLSSVVSSDFCVLYYCNTYYTYYITVIFCIFISKCLKECRKDNTYYHFTDWKLRSQRSSGHLLNGCCSQKQEWKYTNMKNYLSVWYNPISTLLIISIEFQFICCQIQSRHLLGASHWLVQC